MCCYQKNAAAVFCPGIIQHGVTTTVWYPVCCGRNDYVSLQSFSFLINYLMALCISVGLDPPVATVQSVPPATVAPHSPHITTATRHPIAVPPTKTVSTKKPQPSVTEAKAAILTSLRLPTVSAQKTAPPQPGMYQKLPAGVWFKCCVYNLQ